MNIVDSRITAFIARHHVLTLATVCDNQPYCSNMFYTYSASENIFVFTSSSQTKHSEQATRNTNIAGSIVLESKVIGKLQGLQFCGVISRADNHPSARMLYLKRFPFAAVMELELWIIEPSFMKFTDNTLGFGKKLSWQKDD